MCQQFSSHSWRTYWTSLKDCEWMAITVVIEVPALKCKSTFMRNKAYVSIIFESLFLEDLSDKA